MQMHSIEGQELKSCSIFETQALEWLYFDLFIRYLVMVCTLIREFSLRRMHRTQRLPFQHLLVWSTSHFSSSKTWGLFPQKVTVLTVALGLFLRSWSTFSRMTLSIFTSSSWRRFRFLYRAASSKENWLITEGHWLLFFTVLCLKLSEFTAQRNEKSAESHLISGEYFQWMMVSPLWRRSSQLAWFWRNGHAAALQSAAQLARTGTTFPLFFYSLRRCPPSLCRGWQLQDGWKRNKSVSAQVCWKYH